MRSRSLILALLACAPATWAAEVCAYVYSVHGDWRLAPQFAVALKPGMELHVGDKIRLMTPARPAHINAGLLNGNLWKQECDSDADCRDVVALPAEAPAATLPQRLRSLLAGFGSHPAPVVFTLSRGGDGEPREAVLRLRGKVADVTPALGDRSGQSLSARLQPFDSTTPVAETVCKAKSACDAPVPSPGLYKLEIRSGDAEPQSAMVLVASEADYRRDEETFAEARRVADSWGNSAHADARHYFLSASLAELHRTAGKTR